MRCDRNLIAAIVLWSFIVSFVLHPCLASVSSTSNADSFQSPAQQTDAEQEKGLKFRLSQGLNQRETTRAEAPAPTTPLSLSETEAVLRRLPPMNVDAHDEQPFRLANATLPPPLTGNTKVVSFASAVAEPAPEPSRGGPLEIIGYAPEGEVPLAPQLSVTFSQPMIAITSQATASTTVPIKLFPRPAGQWRWLGTQTLIFQPDGRFPMATKYTVTIPAGTQSINGGNLLKEKTWSFVTPSPTVKYSYPNNNIVQPRDALIAVEFDQRIDPSAVLPLINVRSGNQTLRTRLATSEEVAAEIARDVNATQHLREVQKDRLVALRVINASGKTEDALPADSFVKISIGVGAPSVEGPERSVSAFDFSFRTVGPFVVKKFSCDDNPRCDHDDAFTIEFSNPLADDVDETKLKVEPALGDLQVWSYDEGVHIRGVKRGRTTYHVTLDSSIKDQFGQTLQGGRRFSFRVEQASPSFTGPEEDFIVLDPDGPPRLSFLTVNYSKLNMRLYSVTADDWWRWLRYKDASTENLKKDLPGRLVASETLKVKTAPDDFVETSIDLSRALTRGYGQMILIIEAEGNQRRKPNDEDDEDERRWEGWVQRTDIALDAISDRTDLIGWATSLKDGKPLASVDLTLLPDQLKSRTGDEGLARFSLQLPIKNAGGSLLVARRDPDVAILPDRTYWSKSGGDWVRRSVRDDLRWYVFDDRKMYQPGEQVHIKGWVRRIENVVGGDVRVPGSALTEISYTLQDPRRIEIKSGKLTLNSFGGFYALLQLPKDMNLGHALLELKAGNDASRDTHYHRFQVQAFRRPEFEITTTNKTNGPAFVGGSVELAVNASYYSGGALPNAPVTWTVASYLDDFTPPNRSDFTFGVWTPWWESRTYEGYSTYNSQSFNSVVDAEGNHRLHIDFDSVNPARPALVTASATVTDVNRQTWSSSTTLLVHPSDTYVGLKHEKTFVEKGQPLIVQTIATDLDGNLVAGRQIKMSAVLLDWKRQNGEWTQVESSKQDCSIQSAVEPVICRFNPTEGGEYQITAVVTDERGRKNESQITIWVSGAKSTPSTSVEDEDVSLIPNQKEYRGGDMAEILVQAPFYPAEGLLTLRRSGIVKSERFRMESSSLTLRIPIEKSWTPNVIMHVDLLGSTAREVPEGVLRRRRIPTRPAYASGQLDLPISTLDRKLTIAATPEKTALEPGVETNVAVDVKDAGGNPVKDSEVALFVVDEAILALTNYKLSDPLETFYSKRDDDVSGYSLRGQLALSPLAQLGGGGNGGGLMGASSRITEVSGSIYLRHGLLARSDLAPPPPNMAPTVEGGEQQLIRLRMNFDPLAVFAASLRTDAEGHAQVKFKLPDNLTRYRVVAVSVAGENKFGIGESSITARMPLMTRSSAPRFLNLGDQFELPFVIQNATDSPMTVDLAVRGNRVVRFNEPSHALQGASAIGRRVTVPANNRVEVRIPTVATSAGVAQFQIGAASGTQSDGAEVSLPVLTPATTESFATYGQLDQGAIAQQVEMPVAVVGEYGGLQIETSSTQLQALTDAFLFLQTYPFECSEQLASRMLSVAALRDILTAFNAEGLPTPKQIEAAVMRDIQHLQGLQNSDGGFSFWKKDEKSWPFLSVHVAHALFQAKQMKFEVPEETLEKSRKYLREIEQHFPSRYGVDAQWAITAYALYVRSQMGDRDLDRARRFVNSNQVKYLPLEANAWLLSVLAGDKGSEVEREAIRRHLANRATETASSAHFVSSYGDDNYVILNSNRRADGLILDALIVDQPENPLIPKLVRSLLDHRMKGRWSNTQENVFILLALNRYFRTYEKVTPNFVARVWLGKGFAGEQQFRGRETDRQQVNVPMSYLTANLSNKPETLLISKDGAGRLYYRVALNYAPKEFNAPAADYGFAVERVYEAVDDPNDVKRDADGTVRIQSGALVRVRLKMVAPALRTHVALMDPLPAGFEIVNPDIAVSVQVPEDKTAENDRRRGGWFWRTIWFDHQNLRDDRAEAFASLLPGGVYDYSYVVRATTPGLFIVPPAKAEEMYHPETFGRTPSLRVRIE